jgi:hypothetical protein
VDFEEEVLQFIKRYLGGPDFEIASCTAALKHESGRGGSQYQDIDQFSIEESENLLKMLEKKRSNF